MSTFEVGSSAFRQPRQSREKPAIALLQARGFFVLRLKFERLQRGWSQDTLGVLARLSHSTISLIENGRYIPTPRELERLAAHLAVAPASLLQPIDHTALAKSLSVGRGFNSGGFHGVPDAPVARVAEGEE